ncbi:ABC transporter permease [Histidinibacterium aquaticum]|uniref:ABC transporter permease subunit n=1 Tax=Histidinibacterium aquaticum TaxID=2613962 RepID=A0A5J5GGZ4_9RHOB|nr:ABC transporter permease subunit [Histidinibacterium aquaticum]KAA9007013.1 ABC transporter permease subunit [Histidinibacterium aquaticum]
MRDVARRAEERADPWRLRPLPLLTLAAMLGPVAAGLWWTLAPATGLDEGRLSAGAFRAVADWPGIAEATRLSLATGLMATLGALGITTLILAGWSGTRAFAALERLLSPLLALPHAAAAFGIAFLIAPSGWIARALSPWLTGWERPPDLLIVQDPWGLALTAGLVAKEVPFLLLMSLAALPQTRAPERQRVAQALGYGRVTGFLKTTFPGLYAQIRLPVYVTLAYSMSTVDVAVILGPNTPPTLSVQIVRWMSDPDIAMRDLAAAAALWQFALVAGAIALWRLAEIATAALGRRWIATGSRGAADPALRAAGYLTGLASAAAVIAGLLGLALWSVAARWSFPEALPEALTARSWMRHGPGALDSFAVTALIAAIATLAALVLTVGSLEAETRHGLRPSRALWLLYLPLLIPQTAFLPGVQIGLLSVGLDTGLGPVIATHIVFVLPYVFLSLAGPWRAFDPRTLTVAATLGAGPDRTLWRIRLPMLIPALLTAAAVGTAVSVGQYLPTLLAGGGRVATLTTEAVALASGGDRRAIGVWSLTQTLVAFLPFALALAVPAVLFRNRRGMAHG